MRKVIDGYQEVEIGLSVKMQGISVSDSHKMVVTGVNMGVATPSLMDAVRCYLSAVPRIEWCHVITAHELGYAVADEIGYKSPED